MEFQATCAAARTTTKSSRRSCAARKTSGERLGAAAVGDERTAVRLIGRNYRTADQLAKVTGKAKYAEDYRAEGMLFCKLLLSPMPHARIRHIDMREALRMPGVRAIVTADDVPPPADGIDDNGNAVKASKWS